MSPIQGNYWFGVWILQYVFPKNKALVLHNQNTVIKVKLTLIQYCYLIYKSCSHFATNVLYLAGIWSRSQLIFSCHVSILFLNLGQFLCLCLWWPLTLLKNAIVTDVGHISAALELFPFLSFVTFSSCISQWCDYALPHYVLYFL